MAYKLEGNKQRIIECSKGQAKDCIKLIEMFCGLDDQEHWLFSKIQEGITPKSMTIVISDDSKQSECDWGGVILSFTWTKYPNRNKILCISKIGDRSNVVIINGHRLIKESKRDMFISIINSFLHSQHAI